MAGSVHPGDRPEDERLLERGEELLALRGAVRRAAAADGTWVVVAGQAGIGKTELVRTALAEMPVREVTVAWGHGSEFERGFAFGVVRQLLEPLVAGASAVDGDGPFEGAARLARAALASPGEEDAGAEGGEPDYATLHGLYWLCINLSDQRPLVLVVDDVQWADEASLRWLGFMVRRVSGVPILLILTVRSGPEATQSVALAELLAQRSTLTLRPRALTADATAQLIARVLGAPATAFAAACHRATRGNPLFLAELLALLRDREVRPDDAAARDIADVGPAQVGELVLRRVDSLGPEAQALVRAAAVLGDGAAYDAVRRLADVAPGDAADIGHSLERAELLALTPSVAFVHPVVRAAVVAALAPGELAALHRRAVALLDADGDLEGAAGHLLHLPPAGDASTVARLREAASRAQARGDAHSAVALLARALDEPPDAPARAEILLDLGRAELRRRPEAAVTHLSAALEAISQPTERAAVADELSRALHTVNRSDEGLAVAEAALGDLPAGAQALRERLVARIGELAAFSGARKAILERLGPVPASVSSDAVRRRLLARRALDAHLAAGPADEVIELATAALDGGRLVEDTSTGSMPLFFALSVLARAGRVDLAEEQLTRAIASARRRGALATYAGALSVRARLHLLRGNVVAAESDAREVGSLEERGLARAFVRAALLSALVEQGRAEEAEAELADSQMTGTVPDAWIFTSALHGRGLVRTALGRREEGLADLLEAGRRQEVVGARNPGDLPWRGSAALALADLEREDEARALAREETKLARAAGADAPLGAALRIAAQVCHDSDLRLEALDYLERSPARLELARALVDHGRALREGGAPAEARPVLQRARELAEECGATVLEGEAADELVAAGARPRRTSTRGAAALTPGERRTAELVAEGMTNREVAQALFVTQKAVEAQLARAFRKLGISSRVRVRAALEGDPTVFPTPTQEAPHEADS